MDRPRGPLPVDTSDLPPLPAAYADILEAGLVALGIRLTPTARLAVDRHVRLLLAWNDAINLTAVRDPADIARVHVLDSLSAVPLLQRAGVRRLLDLGSGGGFPGLPLSAALEAEQALLVDSVGKKVRFLQAAIDAAGLSRTTAAEQARSEALARDPRDRERWPAVTARAVAPLADLVETGLPLVAPGGILVAWKGDAADNEVDAAGAALRALRAGPVRVVDPGIPGLAEHRLVVVQRGGPIEARFPRDVATRRSRPL